MKHRAWDGPKSTGKSLLELIKDLPEWMEDDEERERVRVTDDRLHRAFALLDEIAKEGDGVALAVAAGGEPVAEYVAGVAAPGQEATPETLWPLASISKLYTATAVMRLVEQGVFTLNTTVQSLLSEFAGEGRERVTIRHLLTHTAGVIYESPEMRQRLMAQTSLDDLVVEACQAPLLIAPGTRHSYSDLGFALLGRVASVAAEVPFRELVRTLVLEPGELTATFMPPPECEYERIAYVRGAFAEGTEGAMYNSQYARELAHPAFGTVATVGDLLRFGLLFAPNGTRRILSEATIRAMRTDQTDGRTPRFSDAPATGAAQPWGLGFMVKERLSYPELLSQAAYGHDGATGCALWIDPVHDLTIAFVSNRHINAMGWPAFEQRLSRVVNATVVGMTNRG